MVKTITFIARKQTCDCYSHYIIGSPASINSIERIGLLCGIYIYSVGACFRGGCTCVHTQAHAMNNEAVIFMILDVYKIGVPAPKMDIFPL